MEIDWITGMWLCSYLQWNALSRAVLGGTVVAEWCGTGSIAMHFMQWTFASDIYHWSNKVNGFLSPNKKSLSVSYAYSPTQCGLCSFPLCWSECRNCRKTSWCSHLGNTFCGTTTASETRWLLHQHVLHTPHQKECDTAVSVWTFEFSPQCKHPVGYSWKHPVGYCWKLPVGYSWKHPVGYRWKQTNHWMTVHSHVVMGQGRIRVNHSLGTI